MAAQAPLWPGVRAELAAGAKRTHWMWFIFPQIAGLGHSPMSQTYAISGAAEALAYLAHPLLGPRLREATALVLTHTSRTAAQIFGPVDAAKFRSCLTLFGAVSGEPVFTQALSRFFGGAADNATLARLTPGDAPAPNSTHP